MKSVATKQLLREIEAERSMKRTLKGELAAVRAEAHYLDNAKMKLSSENSRA